MQITSSDAMQAGLGGIQAGQQRLDQAARQIAGNTLPNAAEENVATDRDSVSEALVMERVAQYQAQASAKVVKTADEVLGTLIDTRA